MSAARLVWRAAHVEPHARAGNVATPEPDMRWQPWLFQRDEGWLSRALWELHEATGARPGLGRSARQMLREQGAEQQPMSARWIEESRRAADRTADGRALLAVERDGWCPVLVDHVIDLRGRWVFPEGYDEDIPF